MALSLFVFPFPLGDLRNQVSSFPLEYLSFDYPATNPVRRFPSLFLISYFFYDLAAIAPTPNSSPEYDKAGDISRSQPPLVFCCRQALFFLIEPCLLFAGPNLVLFFFTELEPVLC